jgi:hypothetical protein
MRVVWGFLAVLFWLPFFLVFIYVWPPFGLLALFGFGGLFFIGLALRD